MNIFRNFETYNDLGKKYFGIFLQKKKIAWQKMCAKTFYFLLLLNILAVFLNQTYIRIFLGLQKFPCILTISLSGQNFLEPLKNADVDFIKQNIQFKHGGIKGIILFPFFS